MKEIRKYLKKSLELREEILEKAVKVRTNVESGVVVTAKLTMVERFGQVAIDPNSTNLSTMREILDYCEERDFEVWWSKNKMVIVNYN